ncbi:MAG TPA: hypothetical protein VD930_09745, partial [Gemmatimonadales bacterium]|nr:hypothetical protein [Gemmatimonadales bacterium]
RAAAGCHADPERECSLDMDLGEHVEGNALLGRDLIADPSDPIAELLAQMDLEARLAQMHSSEAGIVQSLLAGETIRGIARAVGVSHQAVWKRRKQALKTWQRLGQEV